MASVDALEPLLDQMTPISTLVEEVTREGAGKTEEAIIEDLLNRIFATMPEEFTVIPKETRDIGWE